MQVLRPVHIKPDTDLELRARAYEQGTSINDLIVQYVREGLRMARTETRDEKRARFERTFAESMQEPMDQRRLPWTARQVRHDGLGWQFYDADDNPVLSDLIRDPEDAAWLLRFVNEFQIDDRPMLFLALRNLLMAARRLDRTWWPSHSGNPFFQDLRKALEPYATYWPNDLEDQRKAELVDDDGA